MSTAFQRQRLERMGVPLEQSLRMTDAEADAAIRRLSTSYRSRRQSRFQNYRSAGSVTAIVAPEPLPEWVDADGLELEPHDRDYIIVNRNDRLAEMLVSIAEIMTRWKKGQRVTLAEATRYAVFAGLDKARSE